MLERIYRLWKVGSGNQSHEVERDRLGECGTGCSRMKVVHMLMEIEWVMEIETREPVLFVVYILSVRVYEVLNPSAP